MAFDSTKIDTGKLGQAIHDRMREVIENNGFRPTPGELARIKTVVAELIESALNGEFKAAPAAAAPVPVAPAKVS